MPFSGIRPFVISSSPETYSLTIFYKSTTEEIVAPTYTAQLPYGASYSVPSPEVSGYTVGPGYEILTGTIPARSVQRTAYYTSNSTIDPIS